MISGMICPSARFKVTLVHRGLVEFEAQSFEGNAEVRISCQHWEDFEAFCRDMAEQFAALAAEAARRAKIEG